MSNARNIAALSSVEVGATADQTKADLNAIGVSGGRKNLIINGGMDVWQRGTDASRASLGVTAYQSVDRWKGYYKNREQQVVEGGLKWLKQSNNHSTATTIALYHHIEGSALTGKTVTLSFKCKSDVDTNLEVYQRVAGVNKALDVSGHTICTSGDGSRVSLTFTLADYSNSVTSSTDNNIRIKLFNASVAVGAYQQITQVQLELGSVATDFEHRSYGEELALCQRYFRQIAQNEKAIAMWSYGNSGACRLNFSEMRSTPAAVLVDNGVFVYYNAAIRTHTSINIRDITSRSIRVNVLGVATLTGSNSLGLYFNSTSYITLDAEL